MRIRMIRTATIAALATALCVGCTTGHAEVQSPVAEMEDAPVLIDVETDLNSDSLLSIDVPVQIGNHETSFRDFFASLGVTEWSLTGYDENVTRGDDKGALVTYDLGDAGQFTVCVFQNMNGSWA